MSNDTNKQFHTLLTDGPGTLPTSVCYLQFTTSLCMLEYLPEIYEETQVFNERISKRNIQ